MDNATVFEMNSKALSKSNLSQKNQNHSIVKNKTSLANLATENTEEKL